MCSLPVKDLESYQIFFLNNSETYYKKIYLGIKINFNIFLYCSVVTLKFTIQKIFFQNTKQLVYFSNFCRIQFYRIWKEKFISTLCSEVENRPR